MTGVLSPVGSLSIGQAVPCLAQLVGGINGSLSFQLPAISAQVKGLLSFTASPPKLSVGAAASAKLAANLQAQVSAGLPGISISASFLAGIAAKLNASLGSLNAQLAVAANFTALLGTAGVQFYSYGGPVNALGSSLSAATSSGFPGGGGAAATCNALVLATQLSPTWAAMGTVFGVGSPVGLVYGGSQSIGHCIPLALSASLALTATVGLVLPSITLQIAAFARLSVQLGIKLPSLAINLQAAIKLAAQLSLVIGATLPSVGVQASLLIELQAQLLQLSAQLSFALGISALLGLGGLAVYSYVGSAGSFGGALAQGTQGGLLVGGAPNGNCNALILATESPATWGALQTFMRVS